MPGATIDNFWIRPTVPPGEENLEARHNDATSSECPILPSDVTIVVPAHNAEQTIERTLRSLVNQSLPGWTAVVVDDGSTDGTAQIVSAWSSRDRRIRLVSQRRSGVSAARNRGIAEAAADWLVFLDADDTIHPGYLKRMTQAVKHAGADAICCGSVRLSFSGRDIERSAPPRLDVDAAALCLRHPPAPLHALMVRRARVLEVGCFDEALSRYEDWDLWLRLVKAGVGFAVEPKRMALYWRSESSLTSNGPQMMQSFRIVAARAQALGDAIAPLTAANAAPLLESQLETALWNSGLAIGRGADPAPILDALLDPVQLPFNKHALASALLRGLAIGCQCRSTEFIHHWHTLAPRIALFLDGLERRIGLPGAAYALTKALERETIRGDFSGVMVLTCTAGVMIGWHPLLFGVQVTSQVDTVMFRLPIGRAVLEAPVWGSLTGEATRRLVLYGGWQRVVGLLGLGQWVPELMRRVDRPVRPVVRWLRRQIHRVRPPGQDAAEPPAPAETLPQGRQGRIMAQVLAEVAASPIGVTVQPLPPPGMEPFEQEGEERVRAWDTFFETVDPWNYDSQYEQVKYDRTFAMIPDGPIGRALELACAEGRFTKRLAERADHVRALDISRIALDRAAERCRDHTNIEYVAADFFTAPIEGTWDLITCSEVLYYMPAGGLAGLAERLAAALNPGGHLIQAHAFDVSRTPGRSGFDWEVPADGREVTEALAAIPTLRHLRQVTTDLYRIDLFQKAAPAGEPVREEYPIDAKLAPKVERFVIWNGPIARRAELVNERAYQIPVLMYHRVATSGPADLARYRVSPQALAEQMRFLRRRGFRTINPAEWHSNGSRGSLLGRPILLTFDDAYLDFYENAWPILRAHDFTAHVFVPTGHVGGTARWDTEFGPPAPIMDWRMIAELAAEEVTFGSHLVSHPRADCLSSDALLREAVRSRAELESVLGHAVDTIAAPFGVTDHKTEQVFATAGYRQGFADCGGMASVYGIQMATPRIEIAAEDDLAAFAAKVGMAAYPPDAGDRIA